MTNRQKTEQTEKIWTREDFVNDARMKKAGRLARACTKHNIDAGTAELLAPRDWNILAALNGITRPSSATVERTIFVLRTVEKVAAR